ncbi:MAG: creatininase family protein [Thermoplasmata archaeon]|nr:creatininase family protein [Thermoplasmata archaeon]
MKILLGEMTREEASKRFTPDTVFLLPVGSVEQHGPHLPLDTDAFDANYACIEAAMRCSDPKPVVLPPVYYGVSLHHMHYKGTITLMPETLITVIVDICTSLVRHGAKKIVVVNGHGGNAHALGCALQTLSHQYEEVLFVLDNGGLAEGTRKRLFTGRNDVHAGEYETSTSLYNRGDLVQLEKAKEGEIIFPSRYLEFSAAERAHYFPFMDMVSSNGVLGNPEKASKEKGKEMWEAMIAGLVNLIEDLKRSG